MRYNIYPFYNLLAKVIGTFRYFSSVYVFGKFKIYVKLKFKVTMKRYKLYSPNIRKQLFPFCILLIFPKLFIGHVFHSLPLH